MPPQQQQQPHDRHDEQVSMDPAASQQHQQQNFPGVDGFDPVDIQPWMTVVAVCTTLLSLTAVGLRILSRRIKKVKLWWDDYVIILAMCWNLVVIGFVFGLESQGMGLHINAVPGERIVRMLQLLVATQVLYVFNLMWIKVSLLLMYYRIFHVPYFKRAAWVVGGFVVAWAVCISFAFVFVCEPVQKLWYPELPGRCVNQFATWIANAVSSIISDIVILCLPIPNVWRLNLKTGEKIALTFTFGLGCFVLLASAYRIHVLLTYTPSDPAYSLAPTVGWTVIEMTTAIVCACLPTLRPVLQRMARTVGIKGSLGGFFSNRVSRCSAYFHNSSQRWPRKMRDSRISLISSKSSRSSWPCPAATTAEGTGTAVALPSTTAPLTRSGAPTLDMTMMSFGGSSRLSSGYFSNTGLSRTPSRLSDISSDSFDMRVGDCGDIESLVPRLEEARLKGDPSISGYGSSGGVASSSTSRGRAFLHSSVLSPINTTSPSSAALLRDDAESMIDIPLEDVGGADGDGYCLSPPPRPRQ